MESKLDIILKYAYSNTQFYNEEINKVLVNNKSNGYDLLKQLPIMTKSDYLMKRDKMLSKSFKEDELLIEKTSGSSGQPFTIYKTEFDRLRQLKESWKFRKKHYDIDSTDTFCRFAYSKGIYDKEANTLIKKNILYLYALDLKTSVMDEFTKAINEFKPTWFFTTPSTLYYYMKFLEKNSLDSKLTHQFKFIELTGEKVLPQIKSEIEMFFKCAVGNNYGTTETYAIAMACKNNNLHVMEDNVFVEVVDDNSDPVDNGVEGNIIVTSYNNTAMPIIRYRLHHIRILDL